MNLFIFGFGYSAGHFARTRRDGYAQIYATARSADKRAALASQGVAAFGFAPGDDGQALRDALAETDHLLVSIPPGAQGDPALAHFAQTIETAPRLRSIVYLSTIGVYGDHSGAWIDESTPPVPSSERSVWRLAAEDRWRKLARDKGVAAHVLRLAGIYGPGQNALVNLRAGHAKRIIKAGQVFNRIHVEDIARAIEAAFAFGDSKAHRVWNICDDEPAPPQDVIGHAATLLGLPLPPAIAHDEAEMTPMARSFYAESKRVRNDRIKADLGITLIHPDYRAGLAALLAADGAG